MNMTATATPKALALVIALALSGHSATATAQDGSAATSNPVSPALGIQRSDSERAPAPPPQPPSAFRNIDGSGNNLFDPTLGQAKQPLRRIAPAAYGDGESTMAGEARPSARVVSNIVHAQVESIPDPAGLSDLFWQWSQFLAHDIDFTGGTEPPEPAPIAVPSGDPWFDPNGTGTQSIAFNRSRYQAGSGLDAGTPRQQLNEVTGWVDASMVYGSDIERARALRTLDGTGHLRTSAGGLLPDSLDGDASDEARFQFYAGDVRVNEQVGLIALQTLFLREHNRQADRFRVRHPEWNDEQLYQAARAMVAAQIQAITWREFLPRLLGRDALPPYRGYRPTTAAAIANEFSTAAYRFGHSMITPMLLRLDAQGQEIEAGHLPLVDAFFSPQRVRDEGGIDPILRGMAAQACERLDVMVIDELRNFLFGPPGADGFDLVSLDIQRGRDHGLPSYNAMRESLGLPRARDVRQVSRDPEVQQRLVTAYGNPDRIDLWTGVLAETPRPGAVLGETAHRILSQQFAALRDGDRFWWETALPPELRAEIHATRLVDIIRRNTDIGSEMTDDPWRTRR
ncbi:MAG TPA: peroxidase family protein [Arenimonas sp.]|nr:peroxidase family protein [Arenimonas sp.]